MLAIWFKNKDEAEECIKLYGSPCNSMNAEGFYERLNGYKTLAFNLDSETNKFYGFCWKEWYEERNYNVIPYSEWKQGKIKTEENEKWQEKRAMYMKRKTTCFKAILMLRL